MQDNIEAVLSVMQFIYDHIMYAEPQHKSDFCQEWVMTVRFILSRRTASWFGSATLRLAVVDQDERCSSYLRLHWYPVLEPGPYPGDQGPRPSPPKIYVLDKRAEERLGPSARFLSLSG